MTQPEALRLAAVPIFDRSITWQSQATIELHRLHASCEDYAQHKQRQDQRVLELAERVLELKAQRDALLEAAREGLSVCRSVSIRHDRRITRDGCLLYAQTEEWCRWAEAEVGPKIEAAIKAVEENT